jgi:hypothetical protein
VVSADIDALARGTLDPGATRTRLLDPDGTRAQAKVAKNSRAETSTASPRFVLEAPTRSF